MSLLSRARPFIAPALRPRRPYGRAGLRDDVTAGVLLTALLVPAGMAYAELAGLPVVSGLHATIAGLVVYALVGPSRILVLGPDSSLAPIIGAAVIPLAAGDPDQALALAGLLALMVGLVLIVGGLLRVGMVTDLLSKPIRVGYLNGIALVVIAAQLPKLFGFSVDGDGLVDDLSGFVEGLADGEVNTAAAILGVSALLIILGMRWRSPRLPALLVAVVGASLVLWLGDLDEVPVVGALPSGLPAPALDGLDWSDVLSLLPAAAGIALVAFADTSVLSRAFAAKEEQEIDENREMAATGAANVGCGLFGGFPISGSSSRTPVAQQSGARTQLAGLVGAACVAILIIIAPGLTDFLPSSVLSAVVIAAVMSLADVPTVVGLWRMRRSEFVMSMAAFVGVAFFGVLEGIGIAVVLSLVAFVVKAWRPHTAELGRIDGRKGYHDLSRNPRGKRIPGLLIIRFDAPVFFANSAEFSRFVRDSVNHAPEPVQWVILASEPITDVDITGRDTMLQLVRDMRDHDLHLVFAELKGPVRDRFARYGITEELGKDRFFPTIGTAVSAYLRATDARWVDWTDR